MTKERVCANGPSMSRRNLLATAPTFAFSTLLAAGAQPASARPKPACVDPHAAWLQDWREAGIEWSNSLCDDAETEQSEAAWDRRDRMRENIVNTRARTLAGMAAQVAWVIEDSCDNFCSPDHGEALALVLSGLQARIV